MTFKQVRKYVAVAGGAGLLAAQSAHAAVDAAFTSAVGTLTTDIPLYGAALIGLAALGVAFTVAIKYVSRIKRVA